MSTAYPTDYDNFRTFSSFEDAQDAIAAAQTRLGKTSLDGTATANTALVPDASKDVTGLHKVTYTQEVVHGSAVTQTLSGNTTLDATHCGKILYVDTDAKVITLPATAAGLNYTIVNAGADGAVAVTISPNADDKIQGIGLSAADNKDLINTKATAKKGDMVQLVGDNLDGWFVVRCHGTWARE